MLTGGFFEAFELPDGTFDRTYTAKQFADYFANFISDGVFANPANQLKVVAVPETMSVTVRVGNGYYQGFWAKLDEEMVIQLSNAAGNVSRYDAVVLRFDFDNRVPTIAVKEGDFNANPTKPQMERDENIYELCLAYVYIGPAVLELTDAVIEDTRPNNSLCGFVTGLVKQIDTVELFAQYSQTFYDFYNRETENYNNWTAAKQGEYDTWTTNKKQDYTDFVDDTTDEYEQYTNQKKWLFEDWFNNLKVQLEGDVAANLQTQIDDLAERQKLLDVKYIEDEKMLYFPMGEISVIDKTLFL